MKSFLYTIILLLSSVFLSAQTTLTNNALTTFNSMEYSKAIMLLENAYGEEKNIEYRQKIIFSLAESYKNIAEYNKALNNYALAKDLGYGTEAELNYALMLQIVGETDKAEKIINDYIDEAPSDERAKKLKKSIVLSKKKPNTDYQIINIEELNTKYNDFAPSFGGNSGSSNTLVFTSTRNNKTSIQEDKWLGTAYSNLYISKQERRYADELKNRSKWVHPVAFNNVINTEFHDGVSCFTKNRTEVYFTRCNYDSDSESGCGIYYSKLINGKWSNPIVIVKSEEGSISGHPAISPNGKVLVYSISIVDNVVGEEIENGGGVESHDLFMLSKLKDGSWSNVPKSLGTDINTFGNEVYPWIDDNWNLYFASDGHPGLGGLDIFKSKFGVNTWGKPENLLAPINSSADDFKLIFNTDNSVGYLSSNRFGGLGMDDIYEVRLLPFYYAIEGRVIDKNTGKLLLGVNIRLEGNDGTISFAETDINGKYTFGKESLKGNVSYKLILKRNKYLAQISNITTFGVPIEQFEKTNKGYLATLKLNVEMDHISDPIVLPHIEYAFNSSELSKVAEKNLDLFVEVLEENKTIVVNLRSHTDHIGNNKSNMKLSQARAQSCVDYLVTRGIDKNRLVAKGMGETNPFEIPENFDSSFESGLVLVESYVSKLDKTLEEEARQYNRRTDFKVLGEVVRRTISTDSLKDISDETIVMEIDTIIDSGAERGRDIYADITVFYTMLKADNYGTVARKYNISVKDLKLINDGLKATRPFEGMVLKVSLSYDYTEYDKKHYRLQRADNSMKKLLEKIGLTLSEFKLLNADFDEVKDIVPGNVVIK